MIVYKLPSLREKKSFFPVVQNIVPGMMAEAFRRNTIVEQLFKDCPYKAGDTVVCADARSANAYGDSLQVHSVCSNYAQMGKDEVWPKNDNPFIVLAWSEKRAEHVACTTNFLKPK